MQCVDHGLHLIMLMAGWAVGPVLCKHCQQNIFLVLLFQVIGWRGELSGVRTGVRKQTESVLDWEIFWRQVAREGTGGQTALDIEEGMLELDKAERVWDDSALGKVGQSKDGSSWCLFWRAGIMNLGAGEGVKRKWTQTRGDTQRKADF